MWAMPRAPAAAQRQRDRGLGNGQRLLADLQGLAGHGARPLMSRPYG
jgi:hypothetical protein